MKEEYLKNTPLFGALTDDEQRAIAKRMRLEQYGPDETLFIKNGETDAFYLVKEGWVKLSTDEQSPVLATLGAGSLLGETDFFSGQPHTMTARTSGEVMVWSLNQAAMLSLLAEQPHLGLHLGLALGRGIAQYYPELALHLASIPLLQDLSPRERTLLAPYLTPQQYAPGATIYRSGDQPTGLFIIDEGAVHLLGDTDDDYTELASGETFGEMAVISATPHSNTAQAATAAILWRLSPADFAGLTQKNPSIKTNLSRNLRARLSASDQAYAVALLGRISLFANLSRTILADIARMLLLRHVPAGEIIFSHGDPGDAMYIIDSGAVVADSTAAPGQMNHRFGDGDFLGETALLTGKTREFTAQTGTHTNLWCLYRTDFDSLLVKYPQLSTALSQTLRDRLNSADSFSAEPHLQKFAVAGGLTRSQLDELSARLQPRRYQGGSTVYFEGSNSDEMYFIEQGQVELWANTVQGQLLLETIGQGDYFGEIALLSGRPRVGTAYALVNTDIWVLTKPDFDEFMRRHPNLGVVMSRILSERMEATLARLSGASPQRSLPAPGGAAAPPYSRPMSPVSGPHNRALTPVNRPPTGAMPPVRVRPVTPPASRPMAALPPRTAAPTGNMPVQPPTPAQFTQPMPPVGQPLPSRPVPSTPTSRPQTQSMPSVGPAQPAGAPKAQSSQNKKQRKRKKITGSQARPTMPMPAVGPASSTKQPKGEQHSTAGLMAVPPAGGISPSTPVMPRSYSNRRIARQRKSVSVWFAQRTFGAKLRLIAILIFIVWLCGIMVPYMIIDALASNFADGGALPGDARSPLQQMQDDGVVGAAAVLPFVETATPTPTDTATPTATPTITPSPTSTPIPTNTPTPTYTPTPTETPTPVFTPTPTETPTRTFTRAPLAPTDTPTPEPTATPNVDFRLVSVRQLTPCENRGKHHIFVKVQDAAGQGINGVPIKVEWAAGDKGNVIANSDTKTDLVGQSDPGRIDFAMFKGNYTVQVMGGSSDIAGPVTPDYGTNETCGEDTNANSLYHISYEVIFQRTY